MSIVDKIEKASKKVDNTDLSGVIKLSKKLVAQSKIVNDLTSALKEESKKLNKIQFEDLPELMNELDLVSTEIEVDGSVFKLSKAEKYFASITKDNAIAWTQAAIGTDGVTSIETDLEGKINEQKTPSIETKTLPWS